MCHREVSYLIRRSNLQEQETSACESNFMRGTKSAVCSHHPDGGGDKELLHQGMIKSHPIPSKKILFAPKQGNPSSSAAD